MSIYPKILCDSLFHLGNNDQRQNLKPLQTGRFRDFLPPKGGKPQGRVPARFPACREKFSCPRRRGSPPALPARRPVNPSRQACTADHRPRPGRRNALRPNRAPAADCVRPDRARGPCVKGLRPAASKMYLRFPAPPAAGEKDRMKIFPTKFQHIPPAPGQTRPAIPS